MKLIQPNNILKFCLSRQLMTSAKHQPYNSTLSTNEFIDQVIGCNDVIIFSKNQCSYCSKGALSIYDHVTYFRKTSLNFLIYIVIFTAKDTLASFGVKYVVCELDVSFVT